MIQPKLLALFTLLTVSPFANGGRNLRSNKHNIFDRVIPVGDPFYPEKSSALKTSTEVSSRHNTKEETDKKILEPPCEYAGIDSDTLNDNEYISAFGAVELTSGIDAGEVMNSDDGVYNSTESNSTSTDNNTESLEAEGFVIPFQFNTESNSTSANNDTEPCEIEGFVLPSQVNTSASTDEAVFSSNFTETLSHQSNSSTLTVSPSEYNLSPGFLSNISDSNETNIALPSNSSMLMVSPSEYNLSSGFLSNISDSNETNIALLGDNLNGATDKLPRIVGGQLTSLSKYPFFVSLEGCGGALVSREIIILLSFSWWLTLSCCLLVSIDSRYIQILFFRPLTAIVDVSSF